MIRYLLIKKKFIFWIAVLFVYWACFCLVQDSSSQVQGVEHVVIIGCDGMSPDGIQKAKTPILDGLIIDGDTYDACTNGERGQFLTLSGGYKLQVTKNAVSSL